jgi:glutaredoxin
LRWLQSKQEIPRIAHVAFQAAARLGKKLCSLGKAYVRETFIRSESKGHLLSRWRHPETMLPAERAHGYDTSTDPFKREEVEMNSATQPYSVFWQPGCSSCVRVKEFLTHLEIPFKSVNVLSDTDGRNELRRLGARSVPVVSKGDQYVYAQSIEDVARFVDRLDAVMDRLPPDVLVKKWMKVLTVALAITPQMPDELFNSPVFPGRHQHALF